MTLLVLAGAISVASAVSPVFTTATPAGAQRGTEIDVVLRGDRLSDAQEIMFYGTGIEVMKIVEAKDNSVKARFKIANDCAIGEHLCRIRTASGISAMRIFMVGTLPQVDEVEPTSSITQAQKIAMGTTVNGTLTSEDVDYFQVEAKKGQRLSVEVEGARLGRTMLDPYISIMDATGKKLAIADDNALLLQDAYASIIVPEDGSYFIELRDSAYGGNNHTYRLHVGSFARPAAVYPAGGKVGEKIDATFIGDPKGDFKQSISLPLQAENKFPVVSQKEGFASSPNWMRVSPFPNVLEVEPNHSFSNATRTKLELPLAFNGIISKAGEADYFRFAARKDQSLEFQVYARKLGSHLDSVITVCDANGRTISQNDDSGGADSYLKLKMPADGDYFLKVADHLNRGGPAYTYRVEVTEPRAVVTLSIPDPARYDNETRKSIVVPRGNRFAVLMNLKRDNFSGEMNLQFDGLPNGITQEKLGPITSAQTQVPVVFEAQADAPIAGKYLLPVLKPVEAGKQLDTLYKHTVGWVRVQNDTVYAASEVNEIAAAITEEVPFKVSIVEPKVPIPQSGTLDLQIVAERKAGFEDPINVKMLYLPNNLGALPEMTIGKGTNTVLYHVNTHSSSEVRKWPIAVVASAKMKDGGLAWVSSQLVTLEVSPRMISGKIDLASVERGKSVKLVCKLEQLVPFEGKATVSLIGLPAAATAEDIQITKDDKEAVFNVVTTEKTPLGQQKNVFCTALIKQNGEVITQTIGRGGVLRVDAPKIKLADAKNAVIASEKPARKGSK